MLKGEGTEEKNVLLPPRAGRELTSDLFGHIRWSEDSGLFH